MGAMMRKGDAPVVNALGVEIMPVLSRTMLEVCFVNRQETFAMPGTG
jgi:hypothetical protein